MPFDKSLIFDSHAHYDDDKFDIDRDEILSSLKDKGVCGVINNGIDLRTSKISIQLTEKYDFIWAAVGIHPHEANNVSNNYIDEIKNMLSNSKVVAIGEIGLDYHYNFAPKQIQRNMFEQQIKLAKELDKPVIIHDREAHSDTIEILRKYSPKGVVHCFSGSLEMAKEIIKMGMYIGLGGAVTFKNAKTPIEVASQIPIERMLLETDAPYMTPVPFRGQRCDSSHIIYTAQKIAEIRNINVDNLLYKTYENAKNLFKIT